MESMMTDMGVATGWLYQFEPKPDRRTGAITEQAFRYAFGEDVDTELALQFALGRAVECALGPNGTAG